MNVRKIVDYSALFTEVDCIVDMAMPQMKIYQGIGRLVSENPEKGAAVAVAEYLKTRYPEEKGFSPRNVRRMRDFVTKYACAPEIMKKAMKIGWTQNVVIFEAELSIAEREWYIDAVRSFGWSKQVLILKISERYHEKESLDTGRQPCYNEQKRGRHENGTEELQNGNIQSVRQEMGTADSRESQEFQHNDHKLGQHGNDLGEARDHGLRSSKPLYLWFHERQRLFHCQLLSGDVPEGSRHSWFPLRKRWRQSGQNLPDSSGSSTRDDIQGGRGYICLS